MREQFIEKTFYASSLKLIDRANFIIGEMAQQGYTLTVRQLYYQFVSRGWLPNTQQNYKRLASVIDDARKAGLVDWDAIEDRTRFLRSIANYDNPTDFLQSKIYGYAEDLWQDQDTYCEVWIEKDALIGVIERPCNRWRVPFFACRGYASSSELKLAGERLFAKIREGKHVIVFHLGDHDPSGLDMTRVNDDAIGMYGYHSGVEVQRLALNMDQIRQYDPPPNPAKETDSRFAEYQAEFGSSSWELDALNPSIIDSLLSRVIESIVDVDKFNAAERRERENQAKLQAICDNFSEVQAALYGRKEQRE